MDHVIRDFNFFFVRFSSAYIKIKILDVTEMSENSEIQTKNEFGR